MYLVFMHPPTNETISLTGKQVIHPIVFLLSVIVNEPLSANVDKTLGDQQLDFLNSV